MLKVLNEVMRNQCQRLTKGKSNELLKLLQNFEAWFGGILGTWEIDQEDLELKNNVNLICSKPYPLPNLHK